MSRNKTSKKVVLSKERERDALELRKQGLSYPQMADELGISIEGCRQAVKRGLASLEDVCAETRVEVRRLEMDRLDELLRSLWDGAKTGDVQAIDRVLKVMDRRARLMGLDDMPPVDLDAAGAGGELVIQFVTATRPPPATGCSEQPKTEE